MKDPKDLFKVLTLAEAMDKLRPFMNAFYNRIEEVRLEEAWGRVTGLDLVACCDLPHFRKSTVDGLAVRSQDTFGAHESLPALITKTGEVVMGEEPNNILGIREGVIIPTGGMLPEGSDAVVMVEHIEDFGDSLYGITKSVGPGENVIEVGEDIKSGKTLFPAFTVIRAQEMGLLAAQGIVNIPVIARLKIGILSTGDEIVAPNISPSTAQTRDINGYTLMGQAYSCRGVVKYYGIVRDNYYELRQKLEQMLEENDIILLSGGSSVGNRDLTAKVIVEVGQQELLFHGLALKPGKPTIAGEINGKLVFGLPGHPTSAMTVFDVLIRPWLDASVKRTFPITLPEGILSQNIYSGSGREEYIRVRVMPRDNKLMLEPIRGKSGLISTMVEADGLLLIDLDTEGLEAGRCFRFRPLR